MTSTQTPVVADPPRVVKHIQYGVWDYYEEKDPDAEQVSLLGFFKTAGTAVESFPYIVRAIKDVFAMPGCKLHMIMYTMAELSGAVIPALSIW